MIGVGIVEFLIILLSLAPPLVLLFSIIKWAVGSAMKDTRASEGSGSARGILDERYAKGEIGREEYEGVRRDIEG